MLIIFGATGDFFAHVGSSLHTTLFVCALTSALSTKQRPWERDWSKHLGTLEMPPFMKDVDNI